MKKLTLFFAWIALVGIFQLNAQSMQINGVVSSGEDGMPFPGVSITVKGTTVGTITNASGEYTLSVPAGSAVLVFSFIGMETQEITIGGRTTIDVTLAVSTIGLDEVVVTALGISREKKSLGYSVQEVSGDAVNTVKDPNFINSLAGKVAGVKINQSNTMGGSANMLIRGTTSLTGDNQPLFVVDGVPLDNSNYNTADQTEGGGGYDYGNAAMDINSEDIESISVLKGAAATALYGSRAAMGVVLIETKKGKASKGLGVTFTTNYQISNIDKSTLPTHQREYGAGYGQYYDDPSGYFFYEDVDGDGTADLVTPGSEDASWGAKFDPSIMVIQWDALDPTLPNFGEKRPWLPGANSIDYFFQQGRTLSNNLSLSGGNDDGTFRLSYTNFDQTGNLPNSSIKKNSLGFNGSYNLSDKLTVSSSVNYVSTEAVGRYGTGYDGGNVMQSFGQWIQTNVDFARLEEFYMTPDGRQRTWNFGYVDDLAPMFFDNPYWVRHKNYENDGRDRLFGNAIVDYKLTDWLSIQGRAALDSYSSYKNERMASGSLETSDFTKSLRNASEMNLDLMLKFNKTFGDLTVNGIAGGNIRRNEMDYTHASTVGGLIIPDFFSIANSVAPVFVEENYDLSGTNSTYGNLSLGYNDLVYVDFTGRRDVSSTLPEENNTYFYPSVSTSILFSNILNIDKNLLSFGKLRLNYAEVGNDAPVYSLLSTYTQNTNFGDLPLFSVGATLNNPNLLPERTKSMEAGVEMYFLKNRVGFDAAVYKTNSLDQIMPVDITDASGVDFMYVNGGEIENKGVELLFKATPVKIKDLQWDFIVNWSKNKNSVIELAEGVDNYLLFSAWDVSVNAAVGEAYGTIKGTNFVYTNGKRTVDADGYFLYEEDADGNVIEDAVLGNIQPDWNMGIGSVLNYKGFSLNVLVDIQKGGDIYSVNTKYGLATGVYDATAGKNAQGGQIRDPLADNGGYLYEETVYADGTPNTSYVLTSDWFGAFNYDILPTAYHVYDASYVKLRDLSISYNLPKSMISSLPIQNATISIVGHNLAILFKNVKYFDPEAVTSSGNNQGIESGSYPTTKTIGFSLKIGF